MQNNISNKNSVQQEKKKGKYPWNKEQLPLTIVLIVMSFFISISIAIYENKPDTINSLSDLSTLIFWLWEVIKSTTIYFFVLFIVFFIIYWIVILTSSTNDKKDTEINLLTIEISIEQRKEILQKEIRKYLNRGFRVLNQTDTTAQLIKPKSFSCLIAFLFFMLFVVGLIVYIIIYLSEKDEQLYIEVDKCGNIFRKW